jgi:preprotein translocase subunit SecG
MKEVVIIANIVLCITIIVFILIQGRGAGLGSAWGGGGETFQTRRGVEVIIMRLTVVFIALFFGVSLVALLLK